MLLFYRILLHFITKKIRMVNVRVFKIQVHYFMRIKTLPLQKN